MTRSKRVIVAGAGIGGLCCAFELMERGHDVTVLEASGRPGGHVKTIHDPLPDGLYADVGAEHFTKPGYDQYWKYVEKFSFPPPLPAAEQHAPADRRQVVHRRAVAGSTVLETFGFNAQRSTSSSSTAGPSCRSSTSVRTSMRSGMSISRSAPGSTVWTRSRPANCSPRTERATRPSASTACAGATAARPPATTKSRPCTGSGKRRS